LIKFICKEERTPGWRAAARPPPDPRSIYPLFSTEFFNITPENILGTPLDGTMIVWVRYIVYIDRTINKSLRISKCVPNVVL
jgi:hypothetical protein